MMLYQFCFGVSLLIYEQLDFEMVKVWLSQRENAYKSVAFSKRKRI
ncbi:MAG: hypothetical protein ACI86M_000139 [Saprospiraceae bacterium]|jgi:hypothetical protein